MGAIQIFYQIFPDRFANGNPEINLVNNEYYLAGTEKPAIARACMKVLQPMIKKAVMNFLMAIYKDS